MPLQLFESPFPPVALGYDDKKELCRIAKHVVAETLHAYEAFVWRDQCHVSPSRFVLLKASDDIRVYHERKSSNSTDSTPTRDVEALLTVGSVVGSLEDAMYGVLSTTTDAMRLKSAYMHERSTLTNGAVLATVQAPKGTKPFRSLTLKWLVQTPPMPARAVLRPRDLVVVEATGITHLENGERVGFHVIHSVDHLPQLRPLPTFVRAATSVCALWRQQAGTDRLHVYVQSFHAVPERLWASVLLKAAAESLVSIWRHVHCAQMKKLTWLLRRELPTDSTAISTTTKAVGRCKVCTAKATTLCVVCAKAVCAKCRVHRELWSLEPTAQRQHVQALVAHTVAFCVPCLTVAIRQSAADVARDEIPDRGDACKDPTSVRSGSGSQRPMGSGKPRRRRESVGASSTSSERTQDTHDSLSCASSKPNLTSSMGE